MNIPDKLKSEILSYCKTAGPLEARGFIVLGYQTAGETLEMVKNMPT